MSVSIKKEDADKILSPYYEILKKCIFSGWQDYMENYSMSGYRYAIRTKACIIRDHIVGHIKDNFSNTPGVKPREFRDGLFLLEIEKRWNIRFKKLDCSLRPSNYPTIQTTMFNDQQLFKRGQQLVFEGMDTPRPVYLNAGYIPDRTWSYIESVHIAYPVKKEIVWSIDLTNIVTSETALESLPTLQKEKGRSNVRIKKHLIMNQGEIQNAKDGQ